jgi:hypothetical protein
MKKQIYVIARKMEDGTFYYSNKFWGSKISRAIQYDTLKMAKEVLERLQEKIEDPLEVQAF